MNATFKYGIAVLIGISIGWAIDEVAFRNVGTCFRQVTTHNPCYPAIGKLENK